MIHPDALYRMFVTQYKKRHGDDSSVPARELFITLITRITDEMKNDVNAQMLGHRIKNPARKGEDPSTIAKTIIEELDEKWKDLSFRIKVISGKEFFSRMNHVLTKEYKVAVSTSYAAISLRKEEIDSEIYLALKQFIELLES